MTPSIAFLVVIFGFFYFAVDQSRSLGFSEFPSVVNKKYYIDKSLFLKDFLTSDADVLLLTFPRRSGKSTIASMVEHYFGIEVDDYGTPLNWTEKKNRKYFYGDKKLGLKELKIVNASREISKEFVMGNHPVISLTFAGYSRENFSSTEVRDVFADVISKAFKDHKYLSKAMSRKMENERNEWKKNEILKNFNEFNSYMSRELTDEDSIAESLPFLVECLYEHFDKRTVIIVIDEYDNLINSGYSTLTTRELQYILNTLSNIFQLLFKGKRTQIQIKKGLVTGVLRIAKADLFSGANNFREYGMEDRTFSQYYGFFEDEVIQMLKTYKLYSEEKLKDIRYWYDGYYTVNGHMFNIWSVASCITRGGELNQYWTNTGLVQNVRTIFYLDPIRSEIQKLCEAGGFIMFKLLPNFNQNNYISLNNTAQLQIIDSVSTRQRNEFFSLLFYTGYITQDYEKKPVRRYVATNKEVRNMFLDYVASYYVATKIEKSMLSKAQNDLSFSFQNLISLGKDRSGRDKIVQEFLDHYLIRINVAPPEKCSEFCIHSVMLYVCQKLVLNHYTNSEFLSMAAGYQRPNLKKQDYPDLVFVYQRELVVILEFKYEEAAETVEPKRNKKALEQIDTYAAIFYNNTFVLDNLKKRLLNKYSILSIILRSFKNNKIVSYQEKLIDGETGEILHFSKMYYSPQRPVVSE